MTDTDQALVLLSQSGNQFAFEQLVRRTARLVYARLYLDLGRQRDAEDLTQETFITAWKSIRQLTHPDGFRPWLLTIAKNVAIDAQRHESRQKRSFARTESSSEQLHLALDSKADPAANVMNVELQNKALELLRSLPEEYRVPLMMRYLDEFDCEKIGQQLGLSNGSLRGLLHRGMNMLRQRAKEAGWMSISD